MGFPTQQQGRGGGRGFGRGGGRGSFNGRGGFGGGDRGDRKPFGDRGDRKPFGDRGDRKPFGDRGDRKPFGDRGGRGRGGRGRMIQNGGRKSYGDKKSVVESQYSNVYKFNDQFYTKSLTPGIKIYGEKIVSRPNPEDETEKIDYRHWNPFRSKICAALMMQLKSLPIKKGSHVLYLGAANGTTVSHVSDIVGPDGVVYAIEFSKRSGRDLEAMSTCRSNIIPIIDDARHTDSYKPLVGNVDVIFADLAQPNQAQIVANNAEYFLRPNGILMISIKASCIDSAAELSAVYKSEIEQLKSYGFEELEKVELNDYQRGHLVFVGKYNQ